MSLSQCSRPDGSGALTGPYIWLSKSKSRCEQVKSMSKNDAVLLSSYAASGPGSGAFRTLITIQKGPVPSPAQSYSIGRQRQPGAARSRANRLPSWLLGRRRNQESALKYYCNNPTDAL
jgi:hypothetical protein